jgi:hypothetical protein
MVLLVAWLSIIGPGVVNLLPHPSLVCVDWRLTVVTESNVIYDHSFSPSSGVCSRPGRHRVSLVWYNALFVPFWVQEFVARWVLRIDRSFLQRLRLLR